MGPSSAQKHVHELPSSKPNYGKGALLVLDLIDQGANTPGIALNSGAEISKKGHGLFTPGEFLEAMGAL